jgi:nicotinic acid phosphoribosyltransferase
MWQAGVRRGLAAGGCALAFAGLLAAGARIDSFGVGTALSTSSDAPALGVIY